METNNSLSDKKELAKFLKLSEKTVSKKVATGEWPHIRICNRIRFTVAQVNQILEMNRQDVV